MPNTPIKSDRSHTYLLAGLIFGVVFWIADVYIHVEIYGLPDVVFSPREFVLRSALSLLLISMGFLGDVMIMSHRRAERAARRTTQVQQRLIDTLEATTDVVLFLDADYNIQFVNDAGRKTLGIDSDPAGSDRAWLTEESRQTLHQTGLPAAARDGVWTGEIALRGRDDQPIQVSQLVIAHKTTDGEVESYSLIARDITHHIELEHELEHNLALIKQAVESSGEAIFFTDGDGHITYHNQAFANRFESSNELKDLVVDQNTSRRILEQALGDGFWSGEIDMRTTSGQVIPTLLQANRIIDDTGKTTGVVAVCADLTEHKKAQEKANRLQADLARVARISSMGEMATSLAHELNQPLLAIANYSKACVRQLASDEWDRNEITDTMEKVVAQSHRAGEIIRTLRSLIRKSEPSRQPAQINDIIRETVSLIETRARKQQVEIHTNLAEELPMPPVDRVQIQQVLVNLVWNALESMDSIDSGEHLSIASTIDENGRVCVTVSDTGKGIESENADQIFDSFFTTKADGIGMGLAISRTIIEAHAGRLTACNREDGGAVFQFTLPL